MVIRSHTSSAAAHLHMGTSVNIDLLARDIVAIGDKEDYGLGNFFGMCEAGHGDLTFYLRL